MILTSKPATVPEGWLLLNPEQVDELLKYVDRLKSSGASAMSNGHLLATLVENAQSDA